MPIKFVTKNSAKIKGLIIGTDEKIEKAKLSNCLNTYIAVKEADAKTTKSLRISPAVFINVSFRCWAIFNAIHISKPIDTMTPMPIFPGKPAAQH